MSETPRLELPVIPRLEKIELPVSTTALLVVDMQNDFVHREGSLFVPGSSATIPVVERLLAVARTTGARVVFTQDWHTEDDPEFSVWPRHCLAGSWGAEVVRELAPLATEARVYKLRYDGFFGTSLDHLLRRWEVRTVLIVGTVSNICVLHTAGSAALRGYQVVIAEEGISALSSFDQLIALRQVTFLYQGQVVEANGVRFV